MNKKVYSKLADIPKGTAKDLITEGCLVLEGGAFRGLYTQGLKETWRNLEHYTGLAGMTASQTLIK